MLGIDDMRALAELRHQMRKLVAFSEREARKAGLLPQQHQLLLAVKGLPESERPTIRTLAGRLLLKHHSVVELVGRLVEKGLAERERGEDRREILVRITPAGERVLRRLAAVHHDELQTLGPALLGSLRHILKPDKPRLRGANAAVRKEHGDGKSFSPDPL